jgi:hypothetical protein
MRRYRNSRFNSSADRFDNYRTIIARFGSVGSCGHAISEGDSIGYHRGLRKTICTECWSKWVQENIEAAAYEQQYCPEPDCFEPMEY